uniref:Uncharacterized protein LOC116942010 n=1 Tax=Petromyzon marinus TaxID=7757 RepID=A0AAJ7WTI3_PETMA|nr:uncharacterized protein LOC116942010 [Petromyzon marinus]
MDPSPARSPHGPVCPALEQNSEDISPGTGVEKGIITGGHALHNNITASTPEPCPANTEDPAVAASVNLTDCDGVPQESGEQWHGIESEREWLPAPECNSSETRQPVDPGDGDQQLEADTNGHTAARVRLLPSPNEKWSSAQSVRPDPAAGRPNDFARAGARARLSSPASRPQRERVYAGLVRFHESLSHVLRESGTAAEELLPPVPAMEFISGELPALPCRLELYSQQLLTSALTGMVVTSSKL